MTHLRRAMLEELQRRNDAKNTIYYYLKAVERFAKHFHRPPDQLNHTHLREYQAYLLRERQLEPRTVKLHVSALRFFFVKTLKRPYMLEDIPFPKVPRRLPAILTTDEVARLIDGARNLSDRTMLMVLYSTGMRNAELRHLQVRDIDSRRMLIHIQHGKGGARSLRPPQRDAAGDAPRVLPLDATQDVAVPRHDSELASRQADHPEGRVGRVSRSRNARQARETGIAPSLTAFVRFAPRRGRCRLADDPAPARARQTRTHGYLPALVAAAPPSGRQPA